MRSRRVEFAAANGNRLVGNVELPDAGNVHAWGLYVPCFTCTRTLKSATLITRALAAKGIAMLRFDPSGLGESGGSFADSPFSVEVEDVLAAANFLSSEYGPAELLVGHSLGGAAVLQAAQQIPTRKAVVTIASPASPAHLLRHFPDTVKRLKQQDQAHIKVAEVSYTVKPHFVQSLQAADGKNAVQTLDAALLILHAPGDDTVPVEEAASLFAWARHPKSYISLDNAGHLLSDSDDARYVAGLIAAWARRYLGRL